MVDKYIKGLEALLKPNLRSYSNTKVWKAKATNLIARIYGLNSKQETQIEDIKFVTNYKNSHINNGETCENRANELIKSFITDLENFGIPAKQISNNENDRVINITNTLTQNQSVNVSVIWDIIKDELTGKQAKEVEGIINSDDEAETKKQKISDKLLSLGGNLATNIISTLLTNPAIFGV